MTTDEASNAWTAKSGIKRPGKGWLHSDETMQHEGVVYSVTVWPLTRVCLRISENNRVRSILVRRPHTGQ
jgi:hypothetical protein